VYVVYSFNSVPLNEKVWWYKDQIVKLLLLCPWRPFLNFNREDSIFISFFSKSNLKISMGMAEKDRIIVHYAEWHRLIYGDDIIVFI